MSKTLTLRLPDEDAEEVRRIAIRERRSVNDVGARIVDEWLRLNRFPLIEFRSIGAERIAYLKGRLAVWQVVMIAEGYENDVAKTAEHLDLRPDQAETALGYYSAYPEEIDLALRDNRPGFDKLKELLPQLKRISVTDEDIASVKLDEPNP